MLEDVDDTQVGVPGTPGTVAVWHVIWDELAPHPALFIAKACN